VCCHVIKISHFAVPWIRFIHTFWLSLQYLSLSLSRYVCVFVWYSFPFVNLNTPTSLSSLPSSIFPACSLLVFNLVEYIYWWEGSSAGTKLTPEVPFLSFCNSMEQLRRGGSGRHYIYRIRGWMYTRTYSKAKRCGQAGQAPRRQLRNVKFGSHDTWVTYSIRCGVNQWSVLCEGDEMLPRWRHVYTPKSMEYDRSVSLNTKCPGMNWNWNGMEGNECMRQNRE